MIKTFQHKGLERLYVFGSKAGVQPSHAQKLKRQMARLDAAQRPEDMNVTGWKFHALQGKMQGRYAVSVSGNWRMTFAFEGGDAILLGYEDYH